MTLESRKYYYFITSLPALALDDYKDPMRVRDFVGELEEVLDQKHKNYVFDIVSLRDNRDLLDILLGETYNVQSVNSLMTRQQWEEVIRDEDIKVRGYVRSFISSFKQHERDDIPLNRRQAQDLLCYFFYQHMLAHENDFIRRYFTFDLNLRNVVAALNARKFGLSGAEFVAADGDLVISKLKSSSLSDFGLSGELDYIVRLVEIFEHGDLVATEKYLDTLRWRKIDEINTFSYFEIEVILGFFLKLMMCERWLRLEPKKGHEVFERLIQVEL